MRGDEGLEDGMMKSERMEELNDWEAVANCLPDLCSYLLGEVRYVFCLFVF